MGSAPGSDPLLMTGGVSGNTFSVLVPEGRGSNRVERQAVSRDYESRGVPCLSIAFNMVGSLRMNAVRGTLGVLPQARNRSWKDRMTGLQGVALNVAK